jgi:hypothetical protein
MDPYPGSASEPLPLLTSFTESDLDGVEFEKERARSDIARMTWATVCVSWLAVLADLLGAY